MEFPAMNYQDPNLTLLYVADVVQHAPIRTAESYETVSMAGLIGFEVGFFLLVGFFAFAITADWHADIQNLRASSPPVGQSSTATPAAVIH
jgi:hypothetical protein